MKLRYFRQLVLSLFFFSYFLNINAQNNVGIGTSTPSPEAALHIVSLTLSNGAPQGLIIPYITTPAEAQTLKTAALANAPTDQGLLVFDQNIQCFLFFNATKADWDTICNTGLGTNANLNLDAADSVELTLGSPTSTSGQVQLYNIPSGNTLLSQSSNFAWITKGNYGTDTNNYIGTNDLQNLNFKTGGTAFTNKRMIITNTGKVGINMKAVPASDLFSVTTSNSITPAGINNYPNVRAISGYSEGSNSISIYGEGFSGAAGVHGVSDDSYGLWGFTSGNGTAIRGEASGSNPAAQIVMSGTGVGIDVIQSGPSDGIKVVTNSTANNPMLSAILARNTTNNGFGLWSIASSNRGVGVAGVGGGAVAYTPVSGAGFATGGAFTGIRYGVYGFSGFSPANVTSAGGFFQDSVIGPIETSAFVACYDGANTNGGGAQQFKILGNGVVSTIVPDVNNKEVIMYAPESPEAMFEDYGHGQLKNGSAHIELDKNYAKNVYVDEKYPLKVLVQLEGDCNGVYVTNKNGNGFDVKELNGGTSNVNFTYHVIANRADDYKNGVLVSKNVGNRFRPFSGFPTRVAHSQPLKKDDKK